MKQNKRIGRTAVLLLLLACLIVGITPSVLRAASTQVTLSIPDTVTCSISIQGEGSVTAVADGVTTEIQKEGAVSVKKGQELVLTFHPAESYCLSSILYQGQEQKVGKIVSSWTSPKLQEDASAVITFVKEKQDTSSSSGITRGEGANTGDLRSGFGIAMAFAFGGSLVLMMTTLHKIRK